MRLDNSDRDRHLWRLSTRVSPQGEPGWPSILELGEISVNYAQPVLAMILAAEFRGMEIPDPFNRQYATHRLVPVVRRFAARLMAFSEQIGAVDLELFCSENTLLLPSLTEGVWCIPALRSLLFWRDVVMVAESMPSPGRAEYPYFSRALFSRKLSLHRAALRPNEFWRAGTHFLVLKELPLN